MDVRDGDSQGLIARWRGRGSGHAPSREYRRMRFFAITAAVSFAAIATAGLVAFQLHSERAVRDAILTQARAHAMQFNAVRSYVQGFAGIYVPASEEVTLSPKLATLPGIIPEMTRSDGKRFILQNSPLVARRISEILESQTSEEPVVMRLYGLNPINPLNTPDAFAADAMKRLSAGETEAYSLSRSGQRDTFRYALAIPLNERCGACHEDYKAMTAGVAGVTVVEMDVTRQMLYTTQSRALVGLGIVALLSSSVMAIYLFTTRVLRTMRHAQVQLYEMARRDALTGLSMRHVGMERLAEETARALRQGEPLAVCMIDLDDFKRINDELGHHVGDAALTAVGAAIAARVRPYDTAARVGGEEFLIVMPNTREDEARVVVDRLREGVLSVALRVPALDRAITCSAGIAVLDPAYPENSHALYVRADSALLEAKGTGKNRSTVHRERARVPAPLLEAAEALARPIV